MRPAVDALATRFRVLTISLAGERTSGERLDPRLGFDSFVVQIDRVLERASADTVVLCGVSYGGLIALRYAALRAARVRALVLVSALAPGYAPDRRLRLYLRAPRLLAPMFCAGAWRRARREIRASLPAWVARTRFSVKLTRIVASAPISPALIRNRVRLLEGIDFESCARRVTAPALLITGEPDLDRVVPVHDTLRYLELLPRAEAVRLPRTGHLGLVTRPEEFAGMVYDFAVRCGAIDGRPGARKVAG
jgi:pimeloyl-ACP methyl ester carboxylesterase